MNLFWIVLVVVISGVAYTEGGLLDYFKRVLKRFRWFRRRSANQFSTRPSVASLFTYEGVTEHTDMSYRQTSPYAYEFNDRFWKKQWYAHDYRVRDGPVMDMNLVPVYRRGVTGRGVTVGVFDTDAMGTTHRDLKANFLPELSYDTCLNVPGPPAPQRATTGSHWLQCAGVIAMVANNSYCGVGVAFNAKIAAIVDQCHNRDIVKEANSLNWKLDQIDIYSSSLTIQDDDLLQKTDDAFNKGLKQGRSGKGALYVFPAGNYRHERYHCSLSPYTNHHGTFTIAAASQAGRVVSYSSRCAGVIATTYSGEVDSNERVVSIDTNNRCLNSFHGTSAATPLAAGVFALLLEANPELTYRDVKHLVTMGAEVAPLANNPGSWQRNGAGFWVSHDFGFGLLNAENMVLLAEKWKNVPAERTCIHSVVMADEMAFPAGELGQMKQYIDACKGTGDAIVFLEQLQLTFTVKYPYRGAIALNVTSPSGTKNVLMEPRLDDMRDEPYIAKTISSVQNWGENPAGFWTVDLFPTFPAAGSPVTGRLGTFTFTLRGLGAPPPHSHLLPRTYAGFRLPSGKTSQDPV